MPVLASQGEFLPIFCRYDAGTSRNLGTPSVDGHLCEFDPAPIGGLLDLGLANAWHGSVGCP
jgi:hypothetical protein